MYYVEQLQKKEFKSELYRTIYIKLCIFYVAEKTFN